MFLLYSHTRCVVLRRRFHKSAINFGGWLTRLQVHLISITAWRFCFTLNLFILFIFTSGGFPLVFSLPFTLPLCVVPYFFVSVCVYVIVRLCVFLTTGNDFFKNCEEFIEICNIFTHRTDIFKEHSRDVGPTVKRTRWQGKALDWVWKKLQTKQLLVLQILVHLST